MRELIFSFRLSCQFWCQNDHECLRTSERSSGQSANWSCDAQCLIGCAEQEDPDQLNYDWWPLRLLNPAKKIRAETLNTGLWHGSRWRASSRRMRPLSANDYSSKAVAIATCYLSGFLDGLVQLFGCFTAVQHHFNLSFQIPFYEALLLHCETNSWRGSNA